jgi:pimeloyl-ACP methyl ester carboxylesterase
MNAISSGVRHCWLMGFMIGILSPDYALAQPREFPKSHVIKVEEGVDLHVVDWGGTGAPLLFVPGWASTTHTFDAFAPRFNNSYRVFVMDLRGHGSSSRPAHGYTIERLTLDIAAVLDGLGFDQATLVGLSRSASLITHFAALHPHRVRSLIYLSGPIDREHERIFSARPGARGLRIERSNADDAILDVCGIVDERTFPPGADDTDANVLGVDWRNTDPSPPYPSITVPALAFWGPITSRVLQHQRSCSGIAALDQARVASLINRFIKASFPFFENQVHDIALFKHGMRRGEIAIIPGADYNTFLSHPDLVEERIRDFLESTR